MININEKTRITGLGLAEISREHLQQCLHDRNKHAEPQYEYFGKRVVKGTTIIHSCKGHFYVDFNCEKGWARSIKIY